MRRLRKQRAGCGGLNHPSLFHNHDAIAILRRQPEIVSDEHAGHPPIGREIVDQVHDGLLGRHIEPGRRLVRDQQSRLAGQGDGDHDTLTHTAGQFERVRPVALLGIVDAHLLENLDGFCLEPVARRIGVLAQDIADLIAHRPDRIERDFRVLKDHRDFAAADLAQITLGRGQHVHAAKGNIAAGCPARGIEDAHHVEGRDRFAGPAFADDADHFAFSDLEPDIVERLDDPLAGPELDRKAIDRQDGDWRGLGHRFPFLRSGAADRPDRANRRPAD